MRLKQGETEKLLELDAYRPDQKNEREKGTARKLGFGSPSFRKWG